MQTSDFPKNTPTLVTNCLILRRFTSDDVQAIFEIMSDPQVNTFLPLFPLKTMEEAMEHLKTQYLDRYHTEYGFNYAICLKTDPKPIGYIHLGTDEAHDLGYGLKKAYWHQGIMTEAARALVRQAALTQIPYVTATHDVNNPYSGAVMLNIGMTYCYSYREMWQPKNFLVTFRMYQLNLCNKNQPVFSKYWDMFPDHFIETF